MLKFKPTKAKIKSAATSVVSGVAGYLGVDYAKAKLHAKVDKYGGIDTMDGVAIVGGGLLAASATGTGTAAKVAQGVGVGAALNGAYSMTVRGLAKMKAKKSAGDPDTKDAERGVNSPGVMSWNVDANDEPAKKLVAASMI